jgi:hypothetical protein
LGFRLALPSDVPDVAMPPFDAFTLVLILGGGLRRMPLAAFIGMG